MIVFCYHQLLCNFGYTTKLALRWFTVWPFTTYSIVNTKIKSHVDKIKYSMIKYSTIREYFAACLRVFSGDEVELTDSCEMAEILADSRMKWLKV